MFKNLRRHNKKIKHNDRVRDLAPDEIFIDSENLPKFDVYQFEGRLEKPISARTFFFLSIVFLSIFIIFFSRSWYLQVEKGNEYFQRSEDNRLNETLIFAKRGAILDRNGVRLAGNIFDEKNPEFAKRDYTDLSGLSTILGYLKYPSKDKTGFYYNEAFVGKAGVEKFYDSTLSGVNGVRLVEINASGEKKSESVMRLPKDGEDLKLSIDAKLQNKMYLAIEDTAKEEGYLGGAGVIMDVNNGEILSMVSYPEYDSQILTDGQNTFQINKYLKDKNTPFLNRVVDGLYSPGSIVKPFVAIAALSEDVIDQHTNILSTGSISVPNPYDPSKPTVFKDWKVHGYTDMREAIAVSSDVYFYEIGGGFETQKGLGIENIKKYMKMFGFGSPLLNGFFSGPAGVIPDPEWKKKNFNGENWTVGNTYHTAIGQYGFQVSPIQSVRAVASIANGGKLIDPVVILGSKNENIKSIPLNSEYFKIAREGMEMAVEEGTARGLFYEDFKLGVKTGTAEIGLQKKFINAWAVGFFPYENPKYAFALILEKGPVSTNIGGVSPMRQIFDWMRIYTPEYLKN